MFYAITVITVYRLFNRTMYRKHNACNAYLTIERQLFVTMLVENANTGNDIL